MFQSDSVKTCEFVPNTFRGTVFPTWVSTTPDWQKDFSLKMVQLLPSVAKLQRQHQLTLSSDVNTTCVIELTGCSYQATPVAAAPGV
ncbi:Hypothetical protein SMAX5B_013246 [Scophthalmus maximus]|uniref:Uncharacterized protein n=1 Tax=Scophthalmus maximus TaxID=52904 RepID=A0A2U9CSS5_SCOMX|nr:Hypothetical protein SMAX5B_013246 [Scophthalmus maximus]